MTLKERISTSINEYLESTTIHGFSYLSIKHNLLVKSAWFVIICTCFTLAALLIQQSIEEARLNPVMTNVETIPVQNVPFPAVTIDSGYPDAWGYAEKVFNGLDFESEKLGNLFSFAMHDMILQMNDSFHTDMVNQIPLYIVDRLGQLIEKQTHICEKFPDKKNMLDEDMIHIAKAIMSYKNPNARFVKDYLPDFVTGVQDSEIQNSTDSLCEKWATHYIYFLYKLIGNTRKESPLGFGTLLAYTDSMGSIQIILAIKKFASDFLKNHLKLATISDDFTKANATSFDLVNLLLNWNSWKFGNINEGIQFNEAIFQVCNQDIFNAMFCGKYYDDHLEFRKKNKECCDAVTLDNVNMSNVFDVMRLSLQPPSYTAAKREVQYLEKTVTNLPFENIISNKKLKKVLLEQNFNARMYACHYLQKEYWQTFDYLMKGCNLFQRSFTNNGLGITFNQADFWTVYKKIPYNVAFAEKMLPKGYDLKTEYDQKVQNQNLLYDGKNIKFPESAGKSNELFMVLHQKWRKDGNDKIQPFILSIHDPLLIANMINSSHEVKPGSITTLTVWPQFILTSEDLVANTISERGCQFNFEGSLRLFQEYQQDGCIYECLIEQSYMETNCTPWNYPYFENQYHLCNFLDAVIFEEHMRNASKIHQCQQMCPQECSKTLYSQSVSTELFDIEGMCNDQLLDLFNPNIFERDTQPKGIIKSYEEIIFGKNFSSLEFCKEALKRIAIVRIRLASNTVTAVMRSRRVTFTGHIANLGQSLKTSLRNN